MAAGYSSDTSTAPLRGDTIGANLAVTVDEHGDREALVDKVTNRRWTFAEPADEVARTAAGRTTLGVRKGDRAKQLDFTRQRSTSPDRLEGFSSATVGLMPAEKGAQSGHTVLGFEVPDLEAEIRELESRGVHFEDHDLPDFKTINHIAVMGTERAAWFTDTEGNILCLHELLVDEA